MPFFPLPVATEQWSSLTCSKGVAVFFFLCCFGVGWFFLVFGVFLADCSSAEEFGMAGTYSLSYPGHSPGGTLLCLSMRRWRSICMWLLWFLCRGDSCSLYSETQFCLILYRCHCPGFGTELASHYQDLKDTPGYLDSTILSIRLGQPLVTMGRAGDIQAVQK